jgi:hypothetical protein
MNIYGVLAGARIYAYAHTWDDHRTWPDIPCLCRVDIVALQYREQDLGAKTLSALGSQAFERVVKALTSNRYRFARTSQLIVNPAPFDAIGDHRIERHPRQYEVSQW